jgi:hypothetical protein
MSAQEADDDEILRFIQGFQCIYYTQAPQQVLKRRGNGVFLRSACRRDADSPLAYFVST